MVSSLKTILFLLACTWVTQMIHLSHQAEQRERIASFVNRTLIFKQDQNGRLTLQRHYGQSGQIWLIIPHSDGFTSIKNGYNNKYITCPLFRYPGAIVRVQQELPQRYFEQLQKLTIEFENGALTIKCKKWRRYELLALGAISLEVGSRIILKHPQNEDNQKWIYPMTHWSDNK